jgi:Uri superfamily endonuclease
VFDVKYHENYHYFLSLVYTTKVCVITAGIFHMLILRQFEGFVNTFGGTDSELNTSLFPQKNIQILQNLEFTHAKFLL